MNSIYLDHNSTTPLDPRVADAIRAAGLEFGGNPASQHRTGQSARRRLEQARTHIVEMLGGVTWGVDPDRLIFTSGGTEANNLAILGLLDREQPGLVISAIEHPSLVGAAQAARQLGFSVEFAPVDRQGLVRVDALEALLTQRPTGLVSVMTANNETGVVQPIAAIAALCHRYGALCHTDAVQAVGKIAVSFHELGVDAMTFTPHKFHGPRSIGGLLLKGTTNIRPVLHGGFQQGGLRPGTEDVGLAVGCELALELCLRDLDSRGAHLAQLRELFVSILSQKLGNQFVVHGAAAPRVPHTLNVSFPGVERQALLLAADSVGIAVSTGSACASGSSEPSPVLLAMGLEAELVASALRISFGIMNTPTEVQSAAEQIAEMVAVFRQN